uniref:AlpA family phage regulatory protein n=1 Tax=Bradyrhizobium ottawaense TaxID=931866 RepID=A0A2U8P8P9_9BRAD|nr:AlpA family phage regulatory protein [Bradyrhizobium ottawaense]
MTPEQVSTLLHCHKQTLWKWLRTIPNFPRPVRVSPQRIAFWEHEVRDYITSLERVEYDPKVGRGARSGQRSVA